MDSGLAALLGSAIGFIGSALGTVIVPLITQRGQRRREAKQTRLDALRRLFPELLASGTRMLQPGASFTDLATLLRHLGELDTWLGRDEWQISSMARATLLTRTPDKGDSNRLVLAEFAAIVPVWLRGECTPAQAADLFTARTGLDVERHVPQFTFK